MEGELPPQGDGLAPALVIVTDEPPTGGGGAVAAEGKTSPWKAGGS